MFCSICQDETGLMSTVPCCGNQFHAACLNAWLESHNTCPLCVRQIRASRTVPNWLRLMGFAVMLAYAAMCGVYVLTHFITWGVRPMLLFATYTIEWVVVPMLNVMGTILAWITGVILCFVFGAFMLRTAFVTVYYTMHDVLTIDNRMTFGQRMMLQ